MTVSIQIIVFYALSSTKIWFSDLFGLAILIVNLERRQIIIQKVFDILLCLYIYEIAFALSGRFNMLLNVNFFLVI